MKLENLLILILFIFSTVIVGAGDYKWLDETPYWFWADKWQGSFTVEYKWTHQEAGSLEEHENWNWSGKVTFDQKKRKYDLIIWEGKENESEINLNKKMKIHKQSAKGVIEAYVVTTGEDNCKLDPISGVWMDIENQAFKIEILTDEKYELTAEAVEHLYIEAVDDDGKKWVINESDSEEVKVLPHIMGIVEKKFPEPGQGFDDSEDMNTDNQCDKYIFTYKLEPEYDKNKWRSDYSDILLNKYNKKIMELIEQKKKYCSGDSWVESNPDCLRVSRELRILKRCLAKRVQDGMRIADMLLNREAPFVIASLKRHHTPNIERYITRGAAATVNQIHKYIFSHITDSYATVDSVIAALPNEIKRLYPDRSIFVDLFKSCQVYPSLN